MLLVLHAAFYFVHRCTTFQAAEELLDVTDDRLEAFVDDLGTVRGEPSLANVILNFLRSEVGDSIVRATGLYISTTRHIKTKMVA